MAPKPIMVRQQDLMTVVGMSPETVEREGVRPVLRRHKLTLYDYDDLVALKERYRRRGGDGDGAESVG
jgi:hypothetical protein